MISSVGDGNFNCGKALASVPGSGFAGLLAEVASVAEVRLVASLVLPGCVSDALLCENMVRAMVAVKAAPTTAARSLV